MKFDLPLRAQGNAENGHAVAAKPRLVPLSPDYSPQRARRHAEELIDKGLRRYFYSRLKAQVAQLTKSSSFIPPRPSASSAVRMNFPGKEVFGPTVRVTIDRFHVMKNFQDRLNEAWRELQRQMNKEQARELKGSRWLWMTNPENLAVEQRGELEALKRKFPELGRLAEHREELRQIFQDKRLTTAAAAMARLREWCQSGAEMGLKAIERFNKTLENWIEKIANCFVSRSSNGRTEGFNRGLRAILWRACGMRNFHHFRLRVLHQFG